jgi:hypothetical protein
VKNPMGKLLPLTLLGVINPCHLHDPKGMSQPDDITKTLSKHGVHFATRASTHISVISPSPIFAAFARYQASIILSDDDEVAIGHEDIANVCGHNAEEYNGGVRNDDQEIVNSVLISYRKRRLQQVVTKQARVNLTKWMVEDVLENGQKGLFTRAVRFFPCEFRGSVNSNSINASRWFKSRDEILAAE